MTKVNIALLWIALFLAAPIELPSTFAASDLFHILPSWIVVCTALIQLYLATVTLFGNLRGGTWVFFSFFQLLAAIALGLYINGAWFIFPVVPSGKWAGYQRSNEERFDKATTSLLLDGEDNFGTFKAVTTMLDKSQVIQSGRWENGTAFLNTLSLIDDSHRTFTFKRRGNYLINASRSSKGVVTNIYLQKRTPAGLIPSPLSWCPAPWWGQGRELAILLAGLSVVSAALYVGRFFLGDP